MLGLFAEGEEWLLHSYVTPGNVLVYIVNLILQLYSIFYVYMCDWL